MFTLPNTDLFLKVYLAPGVCKGSLKFVGNQDAMKEMR